MSTTGVKAPTAAQTIAESPWLDDTWVSPANIYGAGEASVTATSFDAGDQTYVLKAYGFDFSALPDNAVIRGVICVVNARYATAPGSIDLMQLLDISRAKVGTNQCATPVALTTLAADYTKGSATDLWGNVLTAAWVKDGDFGVAIGMLAGGTGNNNVDVYCDYVTLEVYYSIPLVIADAAQAQSTEAPALTQHNVLVIQDAGQNQPVENVTLTQHNMLTVADASQVQAAENVTLTQHNVLTVADAGQVQAAENVTLTQHNVLTVADASQGQTAENLTLTAHNPGGDSLTIQDASQAHSAENVNLTQHNIMAIGNTTQVQTAENLALTAHNPSDPLLVIQNASQLMAVELLILIAHGIPQAVSDRRGYAGGSRQKFIETSRRSPGSPVRRK